MSGPSEAWRTDFLAAMTFLTRLPLRRGATEEPGLATLAEASWAFPLVGAVVGLAGGIAYVIASVLGLPATAAALIAVAVTALVTGGLHEDGLADAADGLGGGISREQKLDIMRDSRTGVFGVLALVFSVALRVAALANMGTGSRAFGALIAAHALGRGFLPAAMRYLTPAREEGLGAEAGRPDQNRVLWAAGLAIVFALAGIGARAGLSGVVAAAALMALFAWYAQRQIGGYTGDVLGALEQIGEAAALLAAAAWAP